MIAYIIIAISLILDGLLTNYLPYMINQLSIFTPLLTVVSIFLIFPLYYKKEKQYFITIFLLGIIYDLFYTNLLFMNSILFLLIAFLTKFLYKNYEVTAIKLIIYIGLIVITYESMTGIILFIFQIVPITWNKVFYKITHSLLINIIYAELLLGIIHIIPKKYKKIRIN